jgi:hypothetical protein
MTWGGLLAIVAGAGLATSAEAQNEHSHHHSSSHSSSGSMGGPAVGPFQGEGPIIFGRHHGYPYYNGFRGPVSTGSIAAAFLAGYTSAPPVTVFVPVPQLAPLPPISPPMFNPPPMQGGQGGQVPQPGFGMMVPDNEPVNQGPRVRVSNAEARARAATFIDHGDEHFRKQKFNEAYGRYRDAAKEAPDLAEPYLREAFALAAIGQYENAAKALKRGLALKPDWSQAGFRLKSLYGDNKIAKIAHRESLARVVSEHPHSADLMFLLAVVLYCDDDPQRSQAFFLRAKALEPGDPAYIKGFLDVLARGPAVKPGPADPKAL